MDAANIEDLLHNGKNSNNSWGKWGTYLRAEQQRQRDVLLRIEKEMQEVHVQQAQVLLELQLEMQKELQAVHVELAIQKVKSGIFGILGGATTVLLALGIAIAVWMIKK